MLGKDSGYGKTRSELFGARPRQLGVPSGAELPVVLALSPKQMCSRVTGYMHSRRTLLHFDM